MKLSLTVFFVLFTILMVYDLITLILRGYQSTVSNALLKFAMRFPIIPFLIGILFGHLFWPNLGACLP